MTNFGHQTVALLAAARAGSREALGQLLDAYRAYLLLIAQSELAPDLRAKGGASDLVQQTFLEAQRDFGQFRGETEAELAGWLRQALVNNLASFSRRFRETAKRRLDCEVALRTSPGGADPPRDPVSPEPTPLQEAITREEMGRLREALDALPEDYREAIRLRYQDGLGFDEIGRRLHRTANGARKLWLRAVERLQHELDAVGAGVSE